jgi:hypothetical protein
MSRLHTKFAIKILAELLILRFSRSNAEDVFNQVLIMMLFDWELLGFLVA